MFDQLDSALSELDRARLLLIGSGLALLDAPTSIRVMWLAGVAVALWVTRGPRRDLADNAGRHERVP